MSVNLHNELPEDGIRFIDGGSRRVIHIPREEIETYAHETGLSVKAVYEALTESLDGGIDRHADPEARTAGSWDVSRFFTMPEGRRDRSDDLSASGEKGWDVSRFYTMPAGNGATAEAGPAESGEGWDTSRFFTMPAVCDEEGRVLNSSDAGRWDVSRFYTMPADAGFRGTGDRAGLSH